MARMRIYTVHINPNKKTPYESPVFIEESFSWWAFIFRGFWALYQKLWLVGFGLIALEIITKYLVSEGIISIFTSFIFMLGVQVFFGFHAHDLQRAKLRKQGYITSDIVTSDNLVGAEQRFFERYYPHGRQYTHSPLVPTSSTHFSG